MKRSVYSSRQSRKQPALRAGKKIRLALLQHCSSTANPRRELARLVGKGVNKILPARFKVEAAVTTADTCSNENAFLVPPSPICSHYFK